MFNEALLFWTLQISCKYRSWKKVEVLRQFSRIWLVLWFYITSHDWLDCLWVFKIVCVKQLLGTFLLKMILVLQAVEFRNFWGEESEMRRFKDGSIHEAVLWSNSSLQSDKRLICQKIVHHVLKRYFMLILWKCAFIRICSL